MAATFINRYATANPIRQYVRLNELFISNEAKELSS